MPGPVPVSGLQGFIAREDAFLSPAERYGGVADPSHGHWGEEAEPYPWEAYAGSWGIANTPLGAENKLLGDEPESMTFAAGQLHQDPSADLTPYRTHAAPHPTGSPDTTDPGQSAEFRQQSAEVHGIKTNAGKRSQYQQSMLAQNDHWEGFFNPVPGEEAYTPVPLTVANAVAGWGTNDHRSNPQAKVNQYELATSHRHRRYATGSIPGNYMWLRPGGRPLRKSSPGPARPAVGTGPFYGQDTSLDFNVTGAILQQGATEYVSPPQPYVNPTTQATPGDTADAIALW
jgi:hypothetical protein